MDSDDQDDFEEFGYAFEILEPDLEKSDSITLVCHPSRRLTMDEYVEALQSFINKLDLVSVMDEDQGRLH